MAARKPTASKRATKRRSTAATARRTPVSRTASTRQSKKPLGHRVIVRVGRAAARQQTRQRDIRRSRRDAAILRTTHAGCSKCGGAGVIYKRKKDGSYAGSKSCPAKPAVAKVSRLQVAVASRVGPDKTAGLCGWTCPCGKRQKPRYRDSKEATKALRVHEKRRHGGVSVGGAWFAQIPTNAAPSKTAKPITVTSP